jgi:hypothetical protein
MMMYVKGEIIKNLPVFIKGKFGSHNLFVWKHSLSWQAEGIYNYEINDEEWYPLKIALSEPVDTLCRLYYANSLHGAIEFGRYLADYENMKKKSIFSARLGRNTVAPLTKACDKLKSNYKSLEVISTSVNDKSAVVRVNNLHQKDIAEVIIAGWLQRMMKQENDHDADIEMRSPLKTPTIEYSLKWGRVSEKTNVRDEVMAT